MKKIKIMKIRAFRVETSGFERCVNQFLKDLQISGTPHQVTATSETFYILYESEVSVDG